MDILLSALVALPLLALVLGALLGFAAQRFRRTDNPVADSINALLPQSQCAQCGYPGCRPYAEAIAAGDAINKCPPGGESTIIELANLLDLDPLPLDPDFGEEDNGKLAVIREAECIGCTFCIQACPVDAIIGTAQQMHTVIREECTGCELCVAPCPVDCIDIIALQSEQQPSMPEKSLSEQACIRCALCVEACPVDLLPQQLYWYSQGKDFEKAQEHRLMDCIECGLCHAVCPSHIPLVQYYQYAKSAIREQDSRSRKARHSQQRFDNREHRLHAEKNRAEQRRQQRSELAAGKRSDMIQSALARAKARQTQAGDQN